MDGSREPLGLPGPGQQPRELRGPEKGQAPSGRHAVQASTAAASRSVCQAHGKSRSSSVALARPETMRSSTSLSQAKGSTPFSFAVATKLATIAQCRAPPSEPANRAFLRTKAIARPFCSCRAGGRGPLSLARPPWASCPVPAPRAACRGPRRLPRDGARHRHRGRGMDPGSRRLRRHGVRGPARGAGSAGRASPAADRARFQAKLPGRSAHRPGAARCQACRHRRSHRPPRAS